MAECVPNTVLASAAAFQGLSPKQRQMAVLGLLSSRLVALSPTADVTAAGILARSAAYSGLSRAQFQMIFLQQLCNIRGT